MPCPSKNTDFIKGAFFITQFFFISPQYIIRQSFDAVSEEGYGVVIPRDNGAFSLRWLFGKSAGPWGAAQKDLHPQQDTTV